MLPAHLPVRFGTEGGGGVVPNLTLEPPYRQIWRLPRDRQDTAAAARGLHVRGWVWLH